MKTKLFICIIFIMLIFTTGCDTMCNKFGWFCPDIPTNQPELNIIEDIENAENIIGEKSIIIKKASEEITKKANNINREAIEAKGKLTVDKETVSPHIDNIKNSSNSIIKDTTKINKAIIELEVTTTSLLDNAKQKVEITEKSFNKIVKERDEALVAQKKAEDDKDSQLQKMLQWLIISCIVGSGICVVAFFVFGNKLGLIGAGACILILALASFVQTFFIYLAIIGGCLLLLLLIALIYNIIVQKKAFSQIVKTVEVAKTGLSKDKKEELFGKDGEIGMMNKIQSSSTIDLVKKEKSKMPLWNTMKNKKE